MLCRRSTILPYFQVLRRSTNTPWLLSSSSSYSDTPNTPKKKPKVAPLQERKMIDRFRLRAKGGDGGSGCSSFRRSRHERRGTPDGGSGGRGGDVILECSPTVWDFRHLQHHTNAKRGGHGVSKNKIGSRGTDKVVQVPVGTVIHLVEGEVPSVVETRSFRALDPWEIPDTLETVPSDSDHRKKTNIPSRVEVLERKDFDDSSTHVEKFKKDSGIGLKAVLNASAKFHGQCANLNTNQSRVSVKESISHFEDTEGESKGLENGDGISEGEVEEEEEGEEEEEIVYNVAELTKPGQRVLVARGGDGGLGNASAGYIKSNKHGDGPRTDTASNKHGDGPRTDTTSNLEGDDEVQSSLSIGLPGSESILVLELKSIADVGLVGMPNAGKSTLLGAISRAKPTVGHYAFTTLRPSIGNLNYDDFFSVTVADIPGLIKGAHENRGLGHAFLRHIERTKVLAYVVDLAAALDGRKGIPPWEQLQDLVLELEYHQEGLSNRPSLIVANKIDEEGTEEVLEELKRRVRGVPIFPVCAVLEEGVTELKSGLRALVDGGIEQKLELDGVALN